jgi:hypothetical protein
MPARRAIALGDERSIGCMAELVWSKDLETLARALEAGGELNCEVHEVAWALGCVYLHVCSPRVPRASRHHLCIEYDYTDGMLRLDICAPDLPAWLLLDALIRRLHALQIQHEIMVWDYEDPHDVELIISRWPL